MSGEHGKYMWDRSTQGASYAAHAPNPSTVKGLAETTLSLRKKFGLDKTLMCNITLEKFTEQIAHSAPEYFLDTILRDRGSKNMRLDELMQLYTCFCWQDHGLNTFDLTHSMTAALLLTDPSDVQPSEVKLPFEVFVIRFPQGFFTLEDSRGRKQDAMMAIVHRLKVESGAYRLFIRLCGRADMNDLTTLTSAWEFLADTSEFDSMGEWIGREVPISQQSVASENQVKIDKPALRALRRLVANLCLYVAAKGLGSKPSAKKSKKNKRKAKARKGSRVAPEYWIVGQEVKLDSRLIESAKHWSESQARDASTKEWRVSSQFTVRGHWRNQPHGPGRSLRRRQWIHPYWKGEGAAKIGHLYTTNEEKRMQ